jgi:hypothetical protein
MNEEKRVPIKLEFDFTNKIEAFGAALVPDDKRQLNSITVNMAAILWCCSENPEIAWQELTADVFMHELLHVVQNQLGLLLHEEEIERAIEMARGINRDEIPETQQDCDPYQIVLERAEAAEKKSCGTGKVVAEEQGPGKPLIVLTPPFGGHNPQAPLEKGQKGNPLAEFLT